MRDMMCAASSPFILYAESRSFLVQVHAICVFVTERAKKGKGKTTTREPNCFGSRKGKVSAHGGRQTRAQEPRRRPNEIDVRHKPRVCGGQWRMVATTPSRRIAHLEGLRFISATWIVYAHLFVQPGETISSRIGERPVRMSIFFVLSGFVTHLSSASLNLFGCRAYMLWMVRRCAVLLVTTYASTAFALVIHLLCNCGDFPIWQFVRCMLMVEELSLFVLPDQRNDFCRGAFGYCPNSLAWTVSAFLVLWMLYPPIACAFRASSNRLGGGRHGVVMGVLAPAIAVWASMLALLLVVTVSPGDIPKHKVVITYYTFVFWLGDFIVGIAVGAAVLAERGASSAGGGKSTDEARPLLTAAEASPSGGGVASWFCRIVGDQRKWLAGSIGFSLHGAVADACFVAVALVTFVLPSNVAVPAPLWAAYTKPADRADVDTVCLLCWQTWCHVFSPVIAVYIYASRHGGGLSSRILGHPVFVYFGGLSMSIYLFHRLWALSVAFAFGYRDEVIARHQINKPSVALKQPHIALTFITSLLLFCALWHHFVELRVNAWVRICTSSGRAPPRPGLQA